MLNGLFILVLLVSPIAAQVAPLNSTFDCTNLNFRAIYTACHAGDYSQCCAVGTDYCSGGCCLGGSVCVGQGTSNEKCCAVSDPTDCGLVWLPDVICEGMDFMSSFACPHGSTCDLFADVRDTPAGSPSQIAQNTATQADSSMAMTSSQAVILTVQVTSFWWSPRL
ncbi:hypothetical protein OIDMADRAFT_32205 [Oidiodendron maius Zn]|uniref:Granulins domain-containing protein n=1 Tax=Oidiodendron maius (strain Zn) TaxID=913774 RepID=A0A0C3H3Z9_OIDMZ|nr:hypothetical protein OIDMADRAFT_32205 [Oidiodendron maius Zn]